MRRARSVIALLCVGLWNVATAVADERAFTRVRGADDTVRALIREGDARSESFRAMVDEIHRSNAVVMVQFGFCAKGQVRSCVVNVHGDARQRHIRILVDTRTTNDRLIATIAHELHHSLEIIRTPDGDAMYTAFEESFEFAQAAISNLSTSEQGQLATLLRKALGRPSRA